MLPQPKSLARKNVDDATTPSLTELHSAVDEGEQRVVATLSNVLARVESGSTLTNENRSRSDG
jgi:hypothetical protein